MADDNTAEAAPVEAGEIASTAMLSPCVGGLMRTWTESGTTQLWSVPNAEFVLANQGTGVLSRTCRTQAGNGPLNNPVGRRLSRSETWPTSPGAVTSPTRRCLSPPAAGPRSVEPTRAAQRGDGLRQDVGVFGARRDADEVDLLEQIGVG